MSVASTTRAFVVRCVGGFMRSSSSRARVVWDGLYQSGEPDRYRSLEQCGRYGVIEAYCKALRRSASVLEVGCGVGILLDRFDKTFLERYCGIDVSPVAIEKARKVWPRAEFLVGLAEKISLPEGSFDFVIFNESIYCMDNMLEQFRRCLTFLRDDGFALVSITGLRPDAQQQFEMSFAPNIVSQTSITDRFNGKWWAVYVVSKKTPATSPSRP